MVEEVNTAAGTIDRIELGSRRELLVDDYLIDRLSGATLTLQHPTPREVAIVHDRPWEGNVSYYHTIFRDGDRWRMYYRGAQAQEQDQRAAHEVVCYAESADGIHWEKPELGLIAFQGSTANNIIWDGIGADTFAPFRDPNPACKPEAQYKALARHKKNTPCLSIARWSALVTDARGTRDYRGRL